MDIPEIIQQMVKDKISNAHAIMCTVTEVTGTTCKCSPVDDSADIDLVYLQPETSNGVLMVPAVGSIVAVQMINDVKGVIVMYSEIESIQFLDGSFGGLVKVTDLVTKLNNLENKVNAIITAYNTHVHSGVTTGAGSSGPTPATVSGTLTPTAVNDIENDLITHGTV